MSNLQKEQVLGKYTIVNELGRGGFATVYLAHDTVLHRSVALKILHPILLTDPAFVIRFESEARAIAQFEHPHIATIYELGHYESRLYIAIQLLPGGTLADRIRAHGPLSFADTVRAVGNVAAALDHAHAAGFIHRDVKPSNILFNSRDEAVLTDFGLVKAAESSVIARTTVGSLLGTPPYMAPEVWEGKGDSPRTDVYALGCVLFEMLTGELLFKGETPPAVMLTHFQPHKYPEQWPADTPPAIKDLLERALAREPADRYPSTGALATDLRALAERPADPLAASYQALQAALAAQQWEHAEELARLIGAHEPNYRDLRELAQQAAAGKAQDEQSRLVAQWRDQALTAEREGRIAEAQSAVQSWLAAAPADVRAQAIAQRLARAAAQAQSVQEKPVAEGRHGQITSGIGGQAPAQPARQEPVVEERRGQITSGNSGQVPAQPTRQAPAVVDWQGQVTSKTGEQEQRVDPKTPSTDSAPDSYAVPTRSFWASLLLIIIGWALGGVILAIIDPTGRVNWPLAWISASATAGAITGYALRRIEPALQWKHVLLIALSWTVGALIRESSPGLYLGCAIGSIVTALVLRRAQPKLRWKQILLMVIGWIIGGGIGFAIALPMISARSGGSQSTTTLIALGLLGACFGTAGGAATLWQLYRASRSAETGVR
jgi:hypothetical protein